MTAPTFMRIDREIDGFHVTVDRREGSAGQHWNFWYEVYTIEDAGDSYYAEGMLALHDGIVDDFDGEFDLCPELVLVLSEMGYECPWR